MMGRSPSLQSRHLRTLADVAFPVSCLRRNDGLATINSINSDRLRSLRSDYPETTAGSIEGGDSGACGGLAASARIPARNTATAKNANGIR